MRKYIQITVAFSILLFLVWLRNTNFDDDLVDSNDKVVKISPTPVAVSDSISPTVGPVLKKSTLTNKLTPTPTTKVANKTAARVTVTPIPTLTARATATPIPTSAPTSLYKDGTFTGSTVDAFYGNVQVQISISGGKLTNVTFLQYPNDNSTSQRINSQAMPLLIQEAIQAQSANISGVSGASATSPAFKSSLASALSQAKN